MTRKITPPQIRLIHALMKERAITNDDLHNVIYNQTKKESLKDLTTIEAGKVIDVLQPENPRVTSVSGQPMATPAQKNYILYLAKTAEIKNLDKYLEARHGIAALQWLTAKKASDVITGLKKQVSATGSAGVSPASP